MLKLFQSVYVDLKSRLRFLEEKHDRFKHHAAEELIKINNKFCEIKNVLSKKPNEDDLKLITSEMELLFNIVDKDMERKYSGKSSL